MCTVQLSVCVRESEQVCMWMYVCGGGLGVDNKFQTNRWNVVVLFT